MPIILRCSEATAAVATAVDATLRTCEECGSASRPCRIWRISAAAAGGRR